MKGVVIMQVLAAAVFAAACDSTTEPDTRPIVRFLNATTGMTGNGAFTANGKFAAGSALALGQSACARVSAGTSVSLGFGTANTGGTGLSGNALAALNNQTITDGGNQIMVSTGSATSPMLFLFDNTFPGTLGSNQAAVRFVNLAPGDSTTANTYVVFEGGIGSGTIAAMNIAVGAPTAFKTVTSGANQFSILKLPGHINAVEGSASMLDLPGGTVNTVAIVPNGSGGWQLVNLRSC